jgi:hypothetical protein
MTLARRCVESLLLVLSLSGCSGQLSEDSKDAAADSPTDSAVDSATNPASAFVGTWKVTSGSSLVTCADAPMYPPAGIPSSDVGGLTAIRLGTTAGTIVATQLGGAGCSFTYEVSGRVASLAGLQSCVPGGPVLAGCADDGGVDPWYDGGGHRFDGGGSPYTWTLLAETLTLSADGTTIADAYDERLGNYVSYCEGNAVVFYDCEANAPTDTWTRQ